MEDLEPLVDEITSHLHQNGFLLFHGWADADSPNLATVRWDRAKGDWRSFVEIAKGEGVKTMLLDTASGQGEHENQIGYLTLAWVKDGCLYLYVDSTEWWKDAGRGYASRRSSGYLQAGRESS